MKILSFNCLKRINLFLLTILMSYQITAQKDSLLTRVPSDSSNNKLNMDAVYNRPFLTVAKTPVAIGGYLEANSFYSAEDGLSEGLSFQARRLTMFMSSSIGKRLKFLTELEFEEGGKEIAIEFAAMDLTVNSAFNFRGGIIMNPIGAFNQNHDGPKWEFVERPDVGVNLLPATWSNAGFGIFGKLNSGNWILGYELYATNGFDGSIIDNEENRTFLPATKADGERFEESSNGQAMISGKLAIKNRKIGEIGFSYMGGVYNKYAPDDLPVDKKRRVDVYAVDINTTIKQTGTYIVGEVAMNLVDVPTSYSQQYGNKQIGAFVDVVQPIIKKKIFSWEEASLNLAARLDYADYNVDVFNETGTDIGDDIIAITPAISLRPSGRTVIRLNYRYQWQTDIINNPAAKTATWLFGFSTYF